jgi:hypothetical protein
VSVLNPRDDIVVPGTEVHSITPQEAIEKIEPLK